MDNQDPRLDKLLSQIEQFRTGDFTATVETAGKNDGLDAVIEGLNALGQEIRANGKMIRNYESRANSITQVLLKYTMFDFSEKAIVSGAGDELDAIAVGLNTLAEELQFAHEAEEKHLRSLLETNHFLDSILENIPNMVFVKEARELRFVRFNKAGEQLLGYSRDQLIGRNDHDLFPKEQADIFTEMDRLALQSDTITDIPEERVTTAFGEKILHTKKIPILEDGRAIYLLGISEEITERKTTEQALIDSKHQMETILGNAPNAVVVINEEGFVINWNLKAEQIFGYSAQEAIGQPMHHLIMPKQHVNAHMRGLSHFLKTGEGPVLNKLIEISAVRRDGTEFPIELGISATRSAGKYIFIAFINDITERKRTEMALKDSEERLRRIFETVRDYAIFMLDPDGYVVNWNKGAEMIKGYSAEEIVGKHFSLFYTPEDQKKGRPMKNLTEAKTKGRTEDVGWRVRKDGTLFWADAIFTTLYDDHGNVRGYSKITRDVTEKMKAEEQVRTLNQELQSNIKKLENVNQELEAFTYSVSHDLRAPLRAINGYLKIIEEDYGAKLDEEAIRLMTSVRNNAKKMGQLIEDLLALSRLGRKALLKSEVDMHELARLALEELSRSVGPIKAKVIIHPLPKAKADHNLMLQVFFNLLSNAVKYSGNKSEPLVEIGANESANELVYYIKDNGTGFDMRYYDKLFGIFQRLHDSAEFEGTGVGLALVKRIVTRHEGRVWAQSAPDQGATFYFSLPKN